MTAYLVPRSVVSPYLELGDDVYAKPLDVWKPDPLWDDDMVLAEPVVGQLIWQLEAGVNGLQREKGYAVFQNAAYRSCVGNDETDTFTCVAHGLVDATRVYFRGTKVPDEIVVGKPYYVFNKTDDTFQIKEAADLSGDVLSFATEGYAFSVVATSYRSSADQLIETFDAMEVAQLGEGESASEVVAAFKADAVLGTASGGMVANAQLAATQTDAAAIKSGVRAGLDGKWTDEYDKTFTLAVTDP